MKSSRYCLHRGAKFLLLLFVLCALIHAEASASSLTLFRSVFNTDVYTSGVGGMYTAAGGHGTVVVSGLSGTVTSAYLFWHGQTNYSDVSIGSQVTVN